MTDQEETEIRSDRDIVDTHAMREHGTDEQIAALYAALADAQGEFPQIPRDRQGRTGNQVFKYAPLATVLKAVRPALTKYGLAVVQPFAIGNEFVQVTTVLSHKGGGRISSSSRFRLPGELKDFGSARTYMCRYALNSLLVLDGDADADDLPDPQPIEPSKRQPPPASVTKQAQTQARQSDEAKLRSMVPTREDLEPIREETNALIRAELRRLGLKGPSAADSLFAITGHRTDRLDAEGGEVIAQKWLAALQKQGAA